MLSDQGEPSVVRANPAKFELLARFQVIGGKCWTTPCWRRADSMSETPRANWVQLIVQMVTLQVSNC